mmetsp:Transcript_28621/g.42347  ORF Transcript_28621/g.42347 Transcript_28621/m.42347 type:complete len:161 (+) Transcript_28621:172-654(+)
MSLSTTCSAFRAVLKRSSKPTTYYSNSICAQNFIPTLFGFHSQDTCQNTLNQKTYLKSSPSCVNSSDISFLRLLIGSTSPFRAPIFNVKFSDPLSYFNLTSPPSLLLVQEDHGGFVLDEEEEDQSSNFLWMSSTLKKRKAKMNKHKLRKRRKKLRLKSKK